MFRKGAHYLDWEIASVWIIDPEQRKAYSMSGEEPVPQEVDAGECLAVGSDLTIPLSELFAEVDKRLSRK